MAEKGLFHSPAAKPPTEDDMRQMSNKLNLRCSDEEIKTFHGIFKHTMAEYQRVAEMNDYHLEVKYPRTSGSPPDPKENTHNAWYWRCDIKGAEAGKLAGKKLGIKDNVAVAGVPMMNGSKILEGYTPEIDATIVTRILDAGGRIIGKTACEDMCISASSFTNSKAPVLNPHNTSHTAGGSSGGSAVAVHLGEVDMAIGGDQGGSIRIPSSYCGIVGLKPTFGLVPYTGIYPICITLDYTGPMARTVHDCALLLEAIAGYDGGLDPRQSPDIKVPEYSKLLDVNMKGKKIAMCTEGFKQSKSEVSECVKAACQKLTSLGMVVDEVSIPMHMDGMPIWNAVIVQEFTECMTKGNAGGFCWRGYHCGSMSEAATRATALRPYDYSVTTRMLMLFSEYMSEHYQNKFYNKGHNLVLKLKQAYDDVLKDYDAIVMPTMTGVANELPKEGASVQEQMDAGLGQIENTAPFNASGHPAVTINSGFARGLPVGMMFIGKYHDELSILQIAKAFEQLGGQ